MDISKIERFVFIDGNNFYYKLKDLTAEKKDFFRLLDFDYTGFCQESCKRRGAYRN